MHPERYRTYFELSSEGIWCFALEEPLRIDAPEDEQVETIWRFGRLVECNDAMARMYGLSSARELVGARLSDLLVRDEANRQYLLSFIRGGYRLVDAESREVGKNGQERWFLNNLIGVIEDGRLAEAWGTQRDVTSQRRLEEQLRQAQKMDAIGRLAGAIAHDFSNLLTIVINGASFCQQILPDDHEARPDVNDIREAAERGAILTRQLVSFSRPVPMRHAALDLDEVVTDMARMLRRVLGSQVELVVDGGADPSRIEADRGGVEQVLLNLVVNARDAVSGKGTIRVEVGRDHLAAGAHRSLQAGDYVVLSVTDDGCGMTPEVKARLFEPFFTTKTEGRGTGLGLATVFRIVRQAGGAVDVRSEPGMGSTFRVYFPASAAKDDRVLAVTGAEASRA